MIDLALATLRARWVSFVGTFLALALGVGMIAAVLLVMVSALDVPDRQPERYATAPAVVHAHTDLAGETLAEPPGLPAALVAKVAATGPVVVDRSFFVEIPGGAAGRQTGHPWSVAGFGQHTLTTGRAPAADNEIVVEAGSAQPGQRVRVLAADRDGTYTVVGVVRAVPYESPVFFTDARAATLSPRVDALVASGPAERVRAAVGNEARVLTGADRRAAEPNPDRDRGALINTNFLVGISAAIAGFVTIFVVASTFAFAVDLRKRELALLRAVGATPRQVRRMVTLEALLLGGIAGVVGCAIGLALAPLMVDVLVDNGIAPRWFHLTTYGLPLVLACLIGLGVALSGVRVASRRAAVVRPVQALRESTLDTRAMTRGRWFLAGACLLSTVIAIVFVAVVIPRIVTIPTMYSGALLLPVLTVALLAPALVPPLVRLVMWPVAGRRGAGGMLVRESALTAARRTAATAAPVLLTVGVAVALLGSSSTLGGALTDERAKRTPAEFVVVPDQGDQISGVLVRRLQGIAGVTVSAPVATTVYASPREGRSLRNHDAYAVDPATFRATANVPLNSGSFADLDDGGIIVSSDWDDITVGQTVTVSLADGTEKSLRVVGFAADGVEESAVYLTQRYAGRALPDRVLIKVNPGTDAGTVSAAVSAAARESGARLVPAAEWAASGSVLNAETAWLALLWALGFSLVYSGLAIVNTMVMAASGRVRELAALRLTGATPRQVRQVVAAESVLVAGIGILLAVLAAALSLGGMLAALRQLLPEATLHVPWGTVTIFAAASVVLAVGASWWSARVIARGRPVELAGIRE